MPGPPPPSKSFPAAQSKEMMSGMMPKMDAASALLRPASAWLWPSRRLLDDTRLLLLPLLLPLVAGSEAPPPALSWSRNSCEDA